MGNSDHIVGYISYTLFVTYHFIAVCIAHIVCVYCTWAVYRFMSFLPTLYVGLMYLLLYIFGWRITEILDSLELKITLILNMGFNTDDNHDAGYNTD